MPLPIRSSSSGLSILRVILCLAFLYSSTCILSFPIARAQATTIFSDGQKVVIPSNLTVNGVDILSALNFLQNQMTQLMPSGTVVAFAGSSTPAGWLFCDGSPVPISTYPSLFSAIGGNFNAGRNPPNGEFFLPDLRGRVVAGVDSPTSPAALLGIIAAFSDTVSSVGSFGGAEGISLSAENLAPHTHPASASASSSSSSTSSSTVTDPGHIHCPGNGVDATCPNGGFFSNTGGPGILTAGTIGGSTSYTNKSPTNIQVSVSTSTSTSTTVSVSVENQNSAASSHPNVQPTLILNYIIKT